jgi:endonuclease/exonuclease/phosphatase family metal-dependent hydrolase
MFFAVRFLSCLILVLLSAPALLAQSAQEGRLEVLSYNVHGLPGLITGDDTLARQTAISARLNAFNVVGLQEDFSDAGHARLLAKVTHTSRVRFADTVKGRFYGSGLTFLARPPASGRRGEHYRTFHGVMSAGSDGLASKGFQCVRLRIAPGVELDVYNSHLDAGGSAGDQRARAEQVAHITSAMQIHSRGRAVLFVGDTNLKARRGLDAQTLRRWLKTTGLRCACGVAQKSCCGRIDRILVRSGVGLRLSVKRWSVLNWRDSRGRSLSDHDPIHATLRWRRGPI